MIKDIDFDLSKWDTSKALRFIHVELGSKKHQYCLDNKLNTMFTPSCYLAAPYEHPKLFDGSLD
jgi:hypothetical protein